jgi:GDP-D-mannose dehydratase
MSFILTLTLTLTLTVELLLGDPTKAEKKIGWKFSTSFDNLVKEMVEEDLKMVRGVTEDPERKQA